MLKKNTIGWFLALLALPALLLATALPAFAVSDDAILSKRPPRHLSEFGFFADMKGLKPAEGVHPFAPVTPLFSDRALKFRFVYLPDGEAAGYDQAEALHFPVGTALVKTFAFPADFRQPDKNVRLIETRVLELHEDGWQAWAYLWNDDQTDAELTIAGAHVPIDTVLGDGEPLKIDYAVPNKNQCKECHSISGTITPIGPKARNLNGPFAYADGERNQIDYWRDHGLLKDAPPTAEIPAVPDWRDSSIDLATRVRAWLDVNCAHCHRPEGAASNSGLFLTWNQDDPVKRGIMKRPVAAGRGSGGRDFDVKPGDPDGSILIYRVESTEPGVMMPELGRSIADPNAVAMLRSWVSALK